MKTHIFLALFVAFSPIFGFSLLTSSESQNATDSEETVREVKNFDVLRQLLNQETIIRMSMAKDMLSLKRSLVGEVSTLKQTTAELKKDLQKLKRENERLSNENVQCSGDVNLDLGNSARKVAFTVGASSPSTTMNSSTLVFPRVVYNIGGGYDPNTGVFTAPVNGHFVFFVNVQASASSIYTYLVHNGTPKVTIMAWSSSDAPYQAGPNLAVLKLQKGDTVCVKYYSGTSYVTAKNAPVTTFSGFRI